MAHADQWCKKAADAGLCSAASSGISALQQKHRNYLSPRHSNSPLYSNMSTATTVFTKVHTPFTDMRTHFPYDLISYLKEGKNFQCTRTQRKLIGNSRKPLATGHPISTLFIKYYQTVPHKTCFCLNGMSTCKSPGANWASHEYFVITREKQGEQCNSA